MVWTTGWSGTAEIGLSYLIHHKADSMVRDETMKPQTMCSYKCYGVPSLRRLSNLTIDVLRALTVKAWLTLHAPFDSIRI